MFSVSIKCREKWLINHNFVKGTLLRNFKLYLCLSFEIQAGISLKYQFGFIIIILCDCFFSPHQIL